MWVYHVYHESVVWVASGIATITIPPEEATEIEDKFLARIFMEEKAHLYGIVPVPQRKDKHGVHFDVELAHQSAKEALLDADQRFVQQYITTQLEDRIKMNFPPLPPGGRAAEAIARLGVDLSKYGIRPVGTNVKADAEEAQAKQEELMALRLRAAEQDEKIARLTMMMEKLMAAKQSDTPPPNDAQPESQPTPETEPEPEVTGISRRRR